MIRIKIKRFITGGFHGEAILQTTLSITCSFKLLGFDVPFDEQIVSHVTCILRVQNEQFSEEKGFILRYTEKEVGL